MKINRKCSFFIWYSVLYLDCDFIIQRNFVDFVTLYKLRGVYLCTMHNAQCTKDRIKNICKVKKVNMEQMLVDCSLGVNAIRQINDTKGMASFSLAKIADYLDCSVDYLLGRTDSPTVSGNYINSDNNVQAIRTGNGDMTIHAEKQLSKGIDPTTEEFIKIFCNLDFDDKFEVMQLLMEKRKK